MLLSPDQDAWFSASTNVTGWVDNNLKEGSYNASHGNDWSIMFRIACH